MIYLQIHIKNDQNKNDNFFIKVYNLFFSNSCNKLIDLSDIWMLEFTNEGIINREIGLSEELIPLIAMPNSKCYGFLSDTQMTYDDFRNEKFKQKEISSKIFEMYWNKLETFDND